MEAQAHGSGQALRQCSGRAGKRPRPFYFGGFATLFILLLATMPVGCSQGCYSQNQFLGAVPSGTPIVRVLLLEGKPSVSLSATERPTVRVGNSAPRQINLTNGITVPISLTPSGWRIGSALLGTGTMIIEPASPGSVRVDGRAYRGRFRFVRGTISGRFDVINDVDVDGYVTSVVPGEMFKQWHIEAYRAQAIVARTYALYVSRTAAPGTRFDLFADTRSQVYHGIQDETPKSREAVDSTRGVVAVYGPAGQEKVFKAYFSSCCGGITQSAADAFGDAWSEPLSEQRIGARCIESPHFNWAPIAIRKTELTRRFRMWGAANGQPEKGIAEVSRIDIEAVNRYGRPKRFVITDARGYRYSLNSEDFRHAINFAATDSATLGSSFCKPVNDPTVVRFTEGHGFGHGVGLCQWCAEHEAESGITHERIVIEAFPGAKLVRAY